MASLNIHSLKKEFIKKQKKEKSNSLIKFFRWLITDFKRHLNLTTDI